MSKSHSPMSKSPSPMSKSPSPKNKTVKKRSASKSPEGQEAKRQKNSEEEEALRFYEKMENLLQRDEKEIVNIFKTQFRAEDKYVVSYTVSAEIAIVKIIEFENGKPEGHLVTEIHLFNKEKESLYKYYHKIYAIEIQFFDKSLCDSSMKVLTKLYNVYVMLNENYHNLFHMELLEDDSSDLYFLVDENLKANLTYLKDVYLLAFGKTAVQEFYSVAEKNHYGAINYEYLTEIDYKFIDGKKRKILKKNEEYYQLSDNTKKRQHNYFINENALRDDFEFVGIYKGKVEQKDTNVSMSTVTKKFKFLKHNRVEEFIKELDETNNVANFVNGKKQESLKFFQFLKTNLKSMYYELRGFEIGQNSPNGYPTKNDVEECILILSKIKENLHNNKDEIINKIENKLPNDDITLKGAIKSNIYIKRATNIYFAPKSKLDTDFLKYIKKPFFTEIKSLRNAQNVQLVKEEKIKEILRKLGFDQYNKVVDCENNVNHYKSKVTVINRKPRKTKADINTEDQKILDEYNAIREELPTALKNLNDLSLREVFNKLHDEIKGYNGAQNDEDYLYFLGIANRLVRKHMKDREKSVYNNLHIMPISNATVKLKEGKSNIYKNLSHADREFEQFNQLKEHYEKLLNRAYHNPTSINNVKNKIDELIKKPWLQEDYIETKLFTKFDLEINKIFKSHFSNSSLTKNMNIYLIDKLRKYWLYKESVTMIEEPIFDSINKFIKYEYFINKYSSFTKSGKRPFNYDTDFIDNIVFKDSAKDFSKNIKEVLDKDNDFNFSEDDDSDLKPEDHEEEDEDSDWMLEDDEEEENKSKSGGRRRRITRRNKKK